MTCIGIILVYFKPSTARLPSSDRKYPNYDNVTSFYTRDLGSWDKESDCCEVHFEDVGLESCTLKRENFAFCLSCQTNSNSQG